MKTTARVSESRASAELRGLFLYVDGEKQPVGRQTVMAAVARTWQETGIAPEWVDGIAPISKDLAEAILLLESRVANLLLSAEIRRQAA